MLSRICYSQPSLFSPFSLPVHNNILTCLVDGNSLLTETTKVSLRNGIIRSCPTISIYQDLCPRNLRGIWLLQRLNGQEVYTTVHITTIHIWKSTVRREILNSLSSLLPTDIMLVLRGI